MAKPKPNTPASAPADPALDKTQDHASAGETQSPPPEGKSVVTHLIVKARVAGFRRCGRAWPETETTVAVDELAEGDVERLLAEPELIVVPMSQGAAQ